MTIGKFISILRDMEWHKDRYLAGISRQDDPCLYSLFEGKMCDIPGELLNSEIKSFFAIHGDTEKVEVLFEI